MEKDWKKAIYMALIGLTIIGPLIILLKYLTKKWKNRD